MLITFDKVNPTILTDEFLINGVKFDINSVISKIDKDDVELHSTTYDFEDDVDMDIINKIVNNHLFISRNKGLSEMDELRLAQAKSNVEMLHLILSLNGGN